MTDLLAVIVTRNGRDWMARTMSSILDTRGVRMRTLVVDNASTDGSIAWLRGRFPGVERLRLPRDRSWAGANNEGIRMALRDGIPFVAFLNNDVWLPPDALARGVEVFRESPRVGIVGFRVERREPDPDERVLAPTRGPTRRLIPAGHIEGAAMLVRSDLFREIGLFDEGYLFYGEESDFQERVLRTAWERVRIDVPVLHAGGGTARRFPFRTAYRHVYGMVRLAAKWNGMLSGVGKGIRQLRLAVALRLDPRLPETYRRGRPSSNPIANLVVTLAAVVAVLARPDEIRRARRVGWTRRFRPLGPRRPRTVAFVNDIGGPMVGSERSLAELVGALDRTRRRPVVRLGSEGELARTLRAAGVPVSIGSVPAIGRPLRLRSILRWLRAVLETAAWLWRVRPTVLHSNKTPAALIAAFAARLAGVPHVWHVRNPVRRPSRIARWIAARSRGVVTTSEGMAAPLRRALGPEGGRVAVIPNGIDLRARPRRSPEGGGLRVGTIAHFIPFKRHDLFVRAAAVLGERFPEAVFYVAGGCVPVDGGTGSARACFREVIAEADRLGLVGRLAFLGHRTDVPELLARTDLLVVPSDFEPFGRVILEAGAAGVPVVATDAGGPPEILAGTGCPLVAPGDTAALAEAIAGLLADPERRRACGERLRARVEAHYGIDTHVARIERVWRRGTPRRLRVLAFAEGGACGESPAARMRVHALLPELRTRGIDVRVARTFPGKYFRGSRRWRGFRRKLGPLAVPVEIFVWGGIVLHRLVQILAAPRYDVVWLQRELLPFGPAWLERLLCRIHSRVVFDLDDALWVRYAERKGLLFPHDKIEGIVRRCAAVAAGSRHLRRWARARGVPAMRVPTTVTRKRSGLQYPSGRERPAGRERAPLPVVGWIGTSGNHAEWIRILPALQRARERSPFRLRIVSDIPPDGIARGWVEFEPWEADREEEVVASFDIGIAPLADTPWNRGKCAAKVVQYMAAGVPAVASPVGGAIDTIVDGESGFLPVADAAWTETVGRLAADPDLRCRIGEAGRARFERGWTTARGAERLARLFRLVMKGG